MHLEAEIVVIGSGSAGAALAGRLVQAGRDVLLLEAGPDYGAFDSGRWPAELLDVRMLATSHDWGYGQDRWKFERARVMGGCSSHNGAIAAVGHRRDYDDWGLAEWRATEVAPLFEIVARKMRVRTYTRHEAVPFHAQCLDAAEAMGWRIASDLCDLDANDSFGLESINAEGSIRWNAAFAYLDPVRDRTNLQILDRVLVDRITDDAAGATVHALRNGEQLTIHAGTVALCAGVYGTPAILQRSGVGDPTLLTKLGIPVVAALPGVGANLHDHPMFHADRAVGPRLQAWLDDVARTGVLPEEQTLGKAISTQARDGLYDLHIFPVIGSNQTSVLYGRATVEVACMTPQSRGQLRITSRDPTAHPLIEHGYLSDEAGHDLAVLRAGLERANTLLDHPILAALLGQPLTDGSSDAAIRAQVAHYYHPVGTCRMGTTGDPLAVCDATGRVHGLRNVLVADASLIPRIPRANTNLPAVMIGERIARLHGARDIRGDAD
jgi:choline dehydrogenase